MKSSAIKLDPRGVAVLFTIRGRNFIFNAQNGLFLEDVPDCVVGYVKDEPLDATAAHQLSAEGWKDWLDAYRAGIHPDLAPEERQPTFLKPASPDHFMITIAQSCNLGCSYCINQGGTYGQKPRIMPEETARETAGFLARRMAAEDCHGIGTILFGGEPMMAKKSVRIIVDGLLEARAETGTPFAALLCTNGTYWDEELFEIFALHADSMGVAISIDGKKEMHDKNRPFVNARSGSSYDRALKTIERLVQMGVRVSVTCVVAPPNNPVEMAEDLHRIGVRRVEMKELLPYVFGTKDKPEVMRREFEHWREGYVDYADWCLDKGGLLPPSPIFHNDRIALLREFSDKLDHDEGRRLGCRTGDGAGAIDVIGDIYPCDAFIAHPDRAIGNVRDGIDIDKAKGFEHWLLDKGQFRTDSKQCSNCFAKRFCGGGCYASSLDRTGGDLAPLEYEHCAVVRERSLIDLYYISRVRKENPDGVARVFAFSKEGA